MRVKGHHLYVGGIGTGLLLASYREWLLMALTFLLGITVCYLILRGRALILWSKEAVRLWKADREIKQRERLAALRDRRRGPGRLPRGY